MQLSIHEFSIDKQGRTYADVIRNSQPALKSVLKIISQPDMQRRMQEAESIHRRPALVGVVKEIEADPEVKAIFHAKDSMQGKRLRQATGAAIRMIMEGLGWSKTGKKGSIGGMGKFFDKAERYVRK